ncbi:MAG: DUF2889 domain-containing protein [Thermincolia bacterium]
MILLERDIKITVEEVDGKIKVDAHFYDTAHEMKAALLVEPGTMEIKVVKAEMIRVPYDTCQKALELTDSLVGLLIKSGVNDQVKQLVGGAKGCVHLVNLFQESFEGVVQGNIRLTVTGLSNDNRIKKLEEILQGTCIRYVREQPR